MTEIALRQDQAVSLIQDTAHDLTAAMTISRALVQTAFAPPHFKGKPEEGAAAILYGATIDMDPLTALQNIYVIGGRPALYSRAMMAVVLSKGHAIWTEAEGEGTVTVCGKRKGSPKIETVTWTVEMAARAGYTKNGKYQTDPRSMLYARASGDIARRIAPDALLGMAYSVEELEVEVLEQVPADERSGVGRLRAAVPSGAPTEAEPASADGEPPASEPGITKAQLTKLHTVLTKVGYTDRDTALDYYARVTGRRVESSKDLTKAEAVRVIDSLENLDGADPVTGEVTEPELDDGPSQDVLDAMARGE